jgi:hypothetical protein
VADWEAVRSDPLAFADVVGVELSDFQADAIRAPVLGEGPTFVAVVAPRQTGKSQSLAVAAAWAAVRRRGCRVLIVSSAEDRARALLDRVRGILAAPELRASVTEDGVAAVRLTNGSAVESVSASERAIRGRTVDLLVLDEAALMPDDLIEGAALPTVLATEGRVLMASSARVAQGTFYDVVSAGDSGDPDVRTVRWSLRDAGFLSASKVESIRARMAGVRARAELDGVFAGGADLLLGNLVDKAVADVRAPGLEGLAAGDARVWAGVDWAASAGGDHSALVAVGRVPEAGERRFLVAAAHRWPSGYPLVGEPSVIGEIVGCGVPFGRLLAERNGLGEACVQELGRRLADREPEVGGGTVSRRAPDVWRDVMDRGSWDADVQLTGLRERAGFSTRFGALFTTAEMKAAVFSALRLMIERGSLVIPASCSELIRELSLLQVELTAGGSERIEASVGRDDLAHALAFALCPYKAHKGRWRVALLERADPHAEVPTASLGDPGELVSTGGGVSVPRCPVVMSVDGAEVTVPAGRPEQTTPTARLARGVQAAVIEHERRRTNA